MSRWGNIGKLEDVRNFFSSSVGLEQLQIYVSATNIEKKRHFLVYLLKGRMNGISALLNFAAKENRG
jgi:hypothetical protein